MRALSDARDSAGGCGGLQVVVQDMKEVDLIRQREMDITKERIQKVLDAGANVILTTKGIDDLCLKVRHRRPG